MARVKLCPLEPCSTRVGCEGQVLCSSWTDSLDQLGFSSAGAHGESGSFLPQEQQGGSRWGWEPPLG